MDKSARSLVAASLIFGEEGSKLVIRDLSSGRGAKLAVEDIAEIDCRFYAYIGTHTDVCGHLLLGQVRVC